jgi:WhiB family redox-sensing transcriptional regulator
MLPNDRDTTWLDFASCSAPEVNKDIFYPPRDKDTYRTIADEAKSYCYGGNGKRPCPVRQRCLWQAVNTDEQHGIWGGMSHRERNALVRKWQRQFKTEMTLKEYIFQEKEKKKWQ